MAFTARTRLVNPRLGTYFGIFTAAFASLVLMALMFEQLGTADLAVRLLMFAGPIVLFAAIGVCWPRRAKRATISSAGAGCRPSSTGWCWPSARLAAPAFWPLTGAFFSVGFDALCLSLGICAGFVFMGVLLAPFLRKFGAYTIPTLSRPPLREPDAAGSSRPPSSPCPFCCCSRPRRALPPMPRPG